jgi:NADH-quinone oxidoreductase subunit E
LRDGKPAPPTRGAPLSAFRDTSRILAGLPDERPDQGQGGAGAATLAGLKVAKELGMEAPPTSNNAGEGQ